MPWARRAEPVQARAEPGPDEGLQRARAWLQILEAWAWGSSPGFDILQSGAQMHDRKGKILFKNLIQ
jgi:hypothetical protein